VGRPLVVPIVGLVTTAVSILTLQPAVLRREFVDGNIVRLPESHYLDLVLDGRSLRDRLTDRADMVTPLNRAWLPTVPDAIGELLGRRPTEGLQEGRTSLFVCGSCGDLPCGAITVALQLGPDTVTWSEFQWENGYEPATRIDGAPESLTFDRQQYTAAIKNASSRIAEFPYDESERYGRRFLWPWQWGWRLPKG
jgi:hypothetical protein